MLWTTMYSKQNAVSSTKKHKHPWDKNNIQNKQHNVFPALQYDRIEIAYGKFDNIIISPKDKATFAKDLMFINKISGIILLKIKRHCL